MKLTLYFVPTSCATVPYITLTEAGADFDVEAINSRKGQNMSPEFLRINPKHRVPVLLIDGDPLTENVAIQIWIARQFPSAKLLPAGPGKDIKAISLMAWFASGIHPHLTPHARPERYCDMPGSEASVKRVANALLFEDFAIADDLLNGSEWFFDHFTAVDAYFFWCFRRAILFNLDVSAFKNCAAHFERVKQRASVQKVLAYEKAVQAAFAAAD